MHWGKYWKGSPVGKKWKNRHVRSSLHNQNIADMIRLICDMHCAVSSWPEIFSGRCKTVDGHVCLDSKICGVFLSRSEDSTTLSIRPMSADHRRLSCVYRYPKDFLIRLTLIQLVSSDDETHDCLQVSKELLSVQDCERNQGQDRDGHHTTSQRLFELSFGHVRDEAYQDALGPANPAGNTESWQGQFIAVGSCIEKFLIWDVSFESSCGRMCMPVSIVWVRVSVNAWLGLPNEALKRSMVH